MKIGLITSGGDAPGMNACLRAVVRTALGAGHSVVGFERGYEGVVNGWSRIMDARSVSNILHTGGTILGTARCEEIKTSKGVEKAAGVLKDTGVEGLITIGGDGSAHGALAISEVAGIPVVLVPATIDNDIWGTDETIGFDTAVNTAMECVDRIRDTAASFERIFVVEVMGRRRGFIAQRVGLVTGAEVVLVPEIRYSLDKVCTTLIEGRKRGKKSSIVIMAEGAGSSRAVAEQIQDVTGYDTRITVLGYVQRGGIATARSRLLADLFGLHAVRMLEEHCKPLMVGIENNQIVTHSLSEVISNRKELDQMMLSILENFAI